MTRTRVEIAFDGSDYFGWQIQTNTSETIQGKFNQALAKVYKQEVKSVGSGRTDAKVHAIKFYVVFDAPFVIEPNSLVRALNTNLPYDIRALRSDIVSSDFRPTNDAKAREYRYLFTNNDEASPFQQRYLSNIRYDLNFQAMQLACAEFVGKFDFASFQTTGSDIKTTERTIFECSLHEAQGDEHGIIPAHYYIKVVGSGFLKQMVRLMVGAIWEVGKGKLTPEDIRKALCDNPGNHIAAVAPAQGLYKYDIQY